MSKCSKDYLGWLTVLFVLALPLFVIVRNLDEDSTQQQISVVDKYERARLLATAGPICEQLIFIVDDVHLFSISCSQLDNAGQGQRFSLKCQPYDSNESIIEYFPDSISLGKRVKQLKDQFYKSLKINGWIEDDEAFMNPYHSSRQGWSTWRRRIQ